MLIFIALAMLAVAPFVILVVFAGINALSPMDYEMVAKDRARSVLHETGQTPAVVKVMGRQVVVRVDELDVSVIRDNIDENRRWRKAMIEQAMVNTCITLMAQCGVDDVGLLWAFMSNEKGLVSEIRAGPVLFSLDCASATDLQYAGYGRYLFGKAVSEGFLSEATENGVMNYYYSRPAIGSGCSFYDMVDFR